MSRLHTGTRDGSSIGDGVHSSVISHHESRRRHGEPMIIMRQIFFEGVVYQIEEELYSDPDNSSVYTSDDEFEYDKKLPKTFKAENPITEVATEIEQSLKSRAINTPRTKKTALDKSSNPHATAENFQKALPEIIAESVSGATSRGGQSKIIARD